MWRDDLPSCTHDSDSVCPGGTTTTCDTFCASIGRICTCANWQWNQQSATCGMGPQIPHYCHNPLPAILTHASLACVCDFPSSSTREHAMARNDGLLVSTILMGCFIFVCTGTWCIRLLCRRHNQQKRMTTKDKRGQSTTFAN
jgi:hypothetical protein